VLEDYEAYYGEEVNLEKSEFGFSSNVVELDRAWLKDVLGM